MRPLYVPVRMAATALAVVAAAGCMSVGDDGSGGRAKPSQSAGERGGEVPEGGPAVSGGTPGTARRPRTTGMARGRRARAGTGPGATARGRGGEGGKGKDASASAPPAAHPTGAPPPNGGNHGPEPTRTPPAEPTRTAEPEPTPTEEPPASPTPDPTVAEPSSSAHEPPGTQLEQREPAPAAGTPA